MEALENAYYSRVFHNTRTVTSSDLGQTNDEGRATGVKVPGKKRRLGEHQGKDKIVEHFSPPSSF